MNVKKVLTACVSIGSLIGAGFLLKKGLSKETVQTATKTVREVEKTFGGIPLSRFNEIAKSIDSRDYCTIDPWGFLVLHYKSNRGRQNFQTQLDINKASKIFNLNGGPVFPGQRWSHASEFVKRVNEAINFSSSQK